MRTVKLKKKTWGRNSPEFEKQFGSEYSEGSLLGCVREPDPAEEWDADSVRMSNVRCCLGHAARDCRIGLRGVVDYFDGASYPSSLPSQISGERVQAFADAWRERPSEALLMKLTQWDKANTGDGIGTVAGDVLPNAHQKAMTLEEWAACINDAHTSDAAKLEILPVVFEAAGLNLVVEE